MENNELNSFFCDEFDEDSLDVLLEEIFTRNMEENDYWSLATSLTKNLIYLTIETRHVSLFDALNGISSLLKNEEKIYELIDESTETYDSIKEILGLNSNIKEYIFDYIIKKINSYFDDLILEVNDSETKYNGEYLELSKELFESNETYYKAENVLFNNLKVHEFEIIDDNLDNGFRVINYINEKYKNVDFRKLCAKLLFKDGYAEEYDKRMTSVDVILEYINDVVDITVIPCDNRFKISFDTIDDGFDYSMPILTLYTNKDYESAILE